LGEFEYHPSEPIAISASLGHDVHITDYREDHMYGFVNNSTGTIYVAESRLAAEAHAGAMGLTRFTVRPVEVLDDTTTYPRAARQPAEDQRCADSMERFLAGGQ
jgi:hypothetical protein